MCILLFYAFLENSKCLLSNCSRSGIMPDTEDTKRNRDFNKPNSS